MWINVQSFQSESRVIHDGSCYYAVSVTTTIKIKDDKHGDNTIERDQPNGSKQQFARRSETTVSRAATAGYAAACCYQRFRYDSCYLIVIIITCIYAYYRRSKPVDVDSLDKSSCKGC
jgi:hypothetical protein